MRIHGTESRIIWIKKSVLPVKIEGVVNGGVIVIVEGLRGFVPASKLSLSYIENLEDYLLKDIEVQVIDVDQANNRLVLSARELLKEKEKAARDAQVASLKVGTVLKGTVETLQNYGAFVKLENGLSGLVHVSQISQKRVKMPSDVLTVGDEVEVKVIGIKDGKISLSMKALEEDKEKAEEKAEKVVIPKAEDIGTNLGDLFKNIQLSKISAVILFRLIIYVIGSMIQKNPFQEFISPEGIFLFLTQ